MRSVHTYKHASGDHTKLWILQITDENMIEMQSLSYLLHFLKMLMKLHRNNSNPLNVDALPALLRTAAADKQVFHAHHFASATRIKNVAILIPATYIEQMYDTITISKQLRYGCFYIFCHQFCRQTYQNITWNLLLKMATGKN